MSNSKILNSVKDIDDAKETISNLLEIINDMKQDEPTLEVPYQGTSIGFIKN